MRDGPTEPRDAVQQDVDKTATHDSHGPKPRERGDRRERPTPAFSRFLLVGRRRRNRRGLDPTGEYYVDRADGTWLRALIALVVMILLDATFTLHILANGGIEVNPVMNWLYGQGWGWFLGVKIATAIVAFPFLTAHRFFGLARTGVGFLLVAYGGVMIVHLVTLAQIHL